MLDFTEHNLTDAVVDRFGACENPRLKQIVQAITRHVHAFVKEVELTQDEWVEAIDFLTKTGHMCDDRRQEFILLSDVFGVSMLVDAINHRMPEGTTETTVLGPFYLGEHKLTANGATLVPEEEGDPIFIEGSIKAPDGSPIVGAIIDMWHTDAEGLYDAQKPELHGEPKMRAQFKSDTDGRFWFKTIVPSSYPIPNDGPVGKLLDATKRHYMRPAHVHFHVSSPGYETLVTHVFLSGDPWLESDAVFGVKKSLIADLKKSTATVYPDNTPAPKSWDLLHYDFGLKPEKRA